MQRRFERPSIIGRQKGKDPMRQKKIAWLGLIVSLSMPAIATTQTIPAVPAGVAAPTSAPSNLWTFLCPNADQKAACKTWYCNSAIGQMINGFAGPMSAMTGGLVQNRCVKNTIENDLKKPADSPAGAAARIKADEAEAKERRAAVRYLSTVECDRWPEAVETLKNALRKDRNECVRFEAALALRTGCCCNNEIIDALKNCVLGEMKTDPNPVERSHRVRAAAAEALARCVMTAQPEMPQEKQLKVEAPPSDPEEYYKQVAKLPRDQVVANARAVLVSMQKSAGAKPVEAIPTSTASTSVASLSAPVATIAPPPTSVFGIVSNAIGPPGEAKSRPPFFDGLTKALTGKQEYVTLAPSDGLPPPRTGTGLPESLPAVPESSPAAPLPFAPNQPNAPAPRVLPLPELVPSRTIDRRDSPPPPVPTLPRNLTRSEAPAEPRPIMTILTFPREPREGVSGVVVVEESTPATRP